MARRQKSFKFPVSKLLNWLQDNPGAHAAGDLGRALGVRRHERRDFLTLLADLAERGQISRLKGDRYRSGSREKLKGKVSLHRDGYGFFYSDSPEPKRVFLPARELRDVMDGDQLEVVAWKDSQGRYEGRLEKVLQRSNSQVIGLFQRSRHDNLVVPFGKDPGQPLIIPRGQALEARPGQVVVADIRVYPTGGRLPSGAVTRILGDMDDPAVEVQVAAHRFQLPNEFGAGAIAAAEKVPEDVTASDLSGREDLRPLPFITIDGETAKDFDDAVSLHRSTDEFVLYVAIADVAHYVRPGEPLDVEARERGTSVYFPGICIPMLPERLSNGICSLNPEVDRLVMVARMSFSRDGDYKQADFFPAVIRSVARLTYHAVQEVLDGETSDVPGIEQLADMADLAGLLQKRRKEEGSLDLDLPEAEIVLDMRGRPEDIVRSERLFSHRIIEEFMLAANQAVASFLEERGALFPYRIHEPPATDRLMELQHYLAHFNLGFNLSSGGPESEDFQDLLAQADDPATSRVINQALLQAMKQARYSAENVGHFGLGMERYCHFTSPIRRYPDLLVHRSLKKALGTDSQKTPGKESLVDLCSHLSTAERRAMEAERDMVQMKKCQYMEKHIGESFTGIIASVKPFGLFLELEQVFVEGLLHVSRLEDDLYHFEEDLQRLVGYNRHRIFKVGDRLNVRVVRVDTPGRQIDFTEDV